MAVAEFARSDAGQGLFGLCRELGKTPAEIGNDAAPSRYFLLEAWRERQERLNEKLQK